LSNSKLLKHIGEVKLERGEEGRFFGPACKRFLATREREPINDNRSSRQLGGLDTVLEQCMTIKLQEQI
jgi:hypothetical protein